MKYINNYNYFINESIKKDIKKYAYKSLYDDFLKLTLDEQKTFLIKLDKIKEKEERINNDNFFKKNIGLFQNIDLFLIYLEQCSANPYCNLKTKNSISEDNYILYKFTNINEYDIYLKVSKGTNWCYHKKELFKDAIHTPLFILINNNLDPENPMYKVTLKKIVYSKYFKQIDCYNAFDWLIVNYKSIIPNTLKINQSLIELN